MNFDDHYQLGYVVKSSGLNGELTIFLDVDDPGYYDSLDLLFLEQNGHLVPHFIERIRITGDKARVKFEEFDTKDEAEKLIGCAIHLPIKYLPKLESGEFYLHQLIGAEICSRGSVIGVVEQFYDLGTQTLLSTTIKGKEVMIPTNKDILKSVDLANARVEVELPEGLLDLYTTS